MSFCLRHQDQPELCSQLWKASASSAELLILLENILHDPAKEKQKTGCSGHKDKSEYSKHAPQQTREVLHQSLVIVSSH